MFDPISKIAKTSTQKTIIWSLIVIFVFFLVFGSKLLRQFGNTQTLEVWGLNLKEENFRILVSNFKIKGNRVNIKYIEKDASTYEEDLKQALIQGTGPDIFMINNSWVGKYKNIIIPLNLNTDKDYNIKNIRDEFPNVVETDFVNNNSLYGLPLSIDTLALYYNRNILDQAGIASAPKTWEELMNILPKLRTVDQYKRVLRSCIPLGLVDNIDHAVDILGLLIMQQGANIVSADHTRVDMDDFTLVNNINTSPAEQALGMYTQFAKPSSLLYNWNSSFPNSLDAFAFGQSVFYIGYASDRVRIQEKNPNLVFGISSIPQFAQSSNKINFASYNSFTVSSRAKDATLAWDLIKYLVSNTVHNEYLKVSSLPPSKRVGVDMCNNDPELAIFCKNILTAKSYYRPDYEEANRAFSNMINDVALKSLGIDKAIQNAKEILEYSLYKK